MSLPLAVYRALPMAEFVSMSRIRFGSNPDASVTEIVYARDPTIVPIVICNTSLALAACLGMSPTNQCLWPMRVTRPLLAVN